MNPATPADACAELLGPAGAAGVMINRLLRVYSDAPAELGLLRAQIASTKQTLDELLPLLDGDLPSLRHPTDVAALEGHLEEIRALIQDIRDCGRRVGDADPGRSGSWAVVQDQWPLADMTDRELRLAGQLDALGIYLDTAKAPAALQVPIQPPQSSQYNRPYSRSVSTLSPESPQARPSECTIRPHSKSVSTMAPSMYQMSIDRSSSVSPATDDGNRQSVFRRDSERTQPNTPSTISTISESQTSYQTSQESFKSSSQRRHQKRLSTWTGVSIPSARRVKSMIMMQSPLSDSRPTTSQLGAGGESGFDSAEFRARVTAYTKGVTPIWHQVTVLDRQKGKQRVYRNRFTRDFVDDLSAEKLQSNFRVVERNLWDAILNQDMWSVTDILEHSWSNNIVVEKHDQLSALHVAASLGLCNMVQAILAKGANPNHPDRYGATALHHAADFGCAGCVDILVSQGAQVDRQTPKTGLKTPLWYATARGKIEAVRALLRLGARVIHQTSSQKETLMYLAIKSGNPEVCKALIAAGADPNESFGLLLLAASRSSALLTTLCKAGAKIDRRDSNRDTLLHKYVSYGNVDMVEFLLSLGANPNSKDAIGNSPLHLAIQEASFPGSLTIVKMLLAKGADPNSRGFLSMTPLLSAVEEGRADIAHRLCRYGANLTALDGKGTHPLLECYKPDYLARRGRNYLANFKATRDVMEHWMRASRGNVGIMASNSASDQIASPMATENYLPRGWERENRTGNGRSSTAVNSRGDRLGMPEEQPRALQSFELGRPPAGFVHELDSLPIASLSVQEMDATPVTSPAPTPPSSSPPPPPQHAAPAPPVISINT